MAADDHEPPRTGAALVTAACASAATVAILGWLYAEWLIVGSCPGLTTCPSRSWGGHYVPLQAVLAAAGLSSAVWVILRVLENRPAREPLLMLGTSAALWALVVWVHTRA